MVDIVELFRCPFQLLKQVVGIMGEMLVGCRKRRRIGMPEKQRNRQRLKSRFEHSCGKFRIR